jgi:hypothetical protein
MSALEAQAALEGSVADRGEPWLRFEPTPVGFGVAAPGALSTDRDAGGE